MCFGNVFAKCCPTSTDSARACFHMHQLMSGLRDPDLYRFYSGMSNLIYTALIPPPVSLMIGVFMNVQRTG